MTLTCDFSQSSKISSEGRLSVMIMSMSSMWAKVKGMVFPNFVESRSIMTYSAFSIMLFLSTPSS